MLFGPYILWYYLGLWINSTSTIFSVDPDGGRLHAQGQLEHGLSCVWRMCLCSGEGGDHQVHMVCFMNCQTDLLRHGVWHRACLSCGVCKKKLEVTWHEKRLEIGVDSLSLGDRHGGGGGRSLLPSLLCKRPTGKHCVLRNNISWIA